MRKLETILTTVFSLLVFSLSFLVGRASAQTPVPPQPVECNDKTDPEFHSLRPYQASPCSSSISGAAFCGNGIAISEQVSLTQTTHPALDERCTKVEADGIRYKCTYETHRARTIAVDLSEAELPILGNTEKVANSQNASDDLSEADKTNEYVSWYLNGITGRAEYGAGGDPNQAVDFSGPLKKLLPQIIQYKSQIATIEKEGTERHNQIVVCGKNKLGIIGDIFHIGGLTPTECYAGNGSAAEKPGVEVLRLNSWDGKLSAWNSYMNDIIGNLVKLLPDIPEEIISDSVLHHWNSRKPPLPWEKDPFTNRPMTNLEYNKYYNEWRGKSCVIVPLIDKLVCIENFLIPNQYADLFPYVPLSSTEDREGSVAISEFGIVATSPDADVKNAKFTNQLPAELFLAHTEEVSDLASQLQSTYVPQGDSSGGAPSVGVAPNNCNLVNIRSNPGDQLFPGEISGDLSYDIEFSCEYDITPGGWIPQECKKNVAVSLGTVTKTPLADEIWSKLVAGNQGVFKRIYPKVGEGGPLECLADIPGATKVTYQGEGLASVTNPEERAGQSPELYFPHLGGIYEYFLKGIQAALRPKGYGAQVIAGQDCQNLTCSSGKIGELPSLPSVSGSCQLSSKSQLGAANLSELPTLVKIVEAAADAYKTPPGLILGIMYGEGVFNPGKYEWTDQNVKNWSMGCTTMPNCTPGVWPSEVVHYYEPYWEAVKDAVKVADPGREPNPCNLMDNIYAISRDLHGNSGAPSFAGKTCFGIPLKTGGGNPNSCSWAQSDFETAIKVWETGAQYMCVTQEGGCASGGLSAVCQSGGDTCETVNRRYSSPSHNACVWDVSQKY